MSVRENECPPHQGRPAFSQKGKAILLFFVSRINNCFSVVGQLVNYLLALFEVLLEGVGEPLGVFDKLALSLLQRLLARTPRNVARNLVHRVQELLDGAGNFPARESSSQRLD